MSIFIGIAVLSVIFQNIYSTGFSGRAEQSGDYMFFT